MAVVIRRKEVTPLIEALLSVPSGALIEEQLADLVERLIEVEE